MSSSRIRNQRFETPPSRDMEKTKLLYLQWFSKERITGYSDVTNAVSLMAWITSFKDKACLWEERTDGFKAPDTIQRPLTEHCKKISFNSFDLENISAEIPPLGRHKRFRTLLFKALFYFSSAIKWLEWPASSPWQCLEPGTLVHLTRFLQYLGSNPGLSACETSA